MLTGLALWRRLTSLGVFGGLPSITHISLPTLITTEYALSRKQEARYHWLGLVRQALQMEWAVLLPFFIQKAST